MAKTACNYRLSDAAIEAIEIIRERTGLSATAVVEMVVREAAIRMDIRDRMGNPVTMERIAEVVESSDDGIAEGYENAAAGNSLGPAAKAKREEKKADRAKRKGELRESVAKVVKNPPARLAPRIEQRMEAAQVGGTRESIDSPCFHPANRRTGGKNWKCNACGYQPSKM